MAPSAAPASQRVRPGLRGTPSPGLAGRRRSRRAAEPDRSVGTSLMARRRRRTVRPGPPSARLPGGRPPVRTRRRRDACRPAVRRRSARGRAHAPPRRRAVARRRHHRLRASPAGSRYGRHRAGARPPGRRRRRPGPWSGRRRSLDRRGARRRPRRSRRTDSQTRRPDRTASGRPGRGESRHPRQ